MQFFDVINLSSFGFIATNGRSCSNNSLVRINMSFAEVEKGTGMTLI